MTLLALALAILIGISLGLLGGGGSTLAVPVLTYVAGLPPKEAIATSLLVVGTTSLLGAARHRAAANVDLRAALLFGAISMAAAFAGGRLSVFIAGWLQLIIFAIVMLIAAISMLRGGGPPKRDAAVSPLAIALAAAGTGLLTGIVGVGGGFMIVPALVMFAHLPIKRAVGTSLLVIAMNSVAGFAGYMGHVTIHAGPTVLFTAFAAAGVALGAALVPHVSPLRLRKGFAVFLILVATFVIYRNSARVFEAGAAAAHLAR